VLSNTLATISVYSYSNVMHVIEQELYLKFYDKQPMKVIDRIKAVTQNFLENSFKKLSIKRKEQKTNPKKTQKYSLYIWLLRHDVVKVFCVVPCVSFCTGHFVMVPLNMTYEFLNMLIIYCFYYKQSPRIYHTTLVSTLFTTFFVWTSLQFIFMFPRCL